MKLKNKKTGEIVEFLGEFHRKDGKPTFVSDSSYTLEKLCEEWEDVPEEWWFIDNDGLVNRVTSYDRRIQMHRDCKEFGNYFETKEEAEKAVEKLKAWKRLKDKGIKVIGWHWVQFGKGDIEIVLDNVSPNGEHFKDIDLLFSEVKNERIKV